MLGACEKRLPRKPIIMGGGDGDGIEDKILAFDRLSGTLWGEPSLRNRLSC